MLARQIGEREVATLLSHTLGEEESSDYLLTELSKPIMQDALFRTSKVLQQSCPLSPRKRNPARS